MVAAVCYATYLLIISKLGKETSLNIIFYTTFFCCLFSIIPMSFETGLYFPQTHFEWVNLILLAFLCQFGGQFLITYGIGKISASSWSIGLLMQPLTATILAHKDDHPELVPLVTQLKNKVGFIGKINEDDLGQKYEDGLKKENVDALKKGLVNLERHINNLSLIHI